MAQSFASTQRNMKEKKRKGAPTSPRERTIRPENEEEVIHNQGSYSAAPQCENIGTVKRGRSRTKSRNRHRNRKRRAKMYDSVLEDEDIPLRLEGYCLDHKVGIAVFTALCCTFFWWL